MGRGDKAKAREFFEKTRRLNIVTHTEHAAAGFELQHLRTSPELPSQETNAVQGKPAAAAVQATTVGRTQANVASPAATPPKAKGASPKAPQKAPGWMPGFLKLW
jgi:hypothetical protein